MQKKQAEKSKYLYYILCFVMLYCVLLCCVLLCSVVFMFSCILLNYICVVLCCVVLTSVDTPAGEPTSTPQPEYRCEYDHIIIESTGVSEPQAVRDLFFNLEENEDVLTSFIYLRCLITVVDSEDFIQKWNSKLHISDRKDLGHDKYGQNRQIVVCLINLLLLCVVFWVLLCCVLGVVLFWVCLIEFVASFYILVAAFTFCVSFIELFSYLLKFIVSIIPLFLRTEFIQFPFYPYPQTHYVIAS